MATVTSVWVAPRRQGVPKTSSPVLTVGDQVMPPKITGAGVARTPGGQVWRLGGRGVRGSTAGGADSMAEACGIMSGVREAQGLRGCGCRGLAGSGLHLLWRGA